MSGTYAYITASQFNSKTFTPAADTIEFKDWQTAFSSSSSSQSFLFSNLQAVANDPKDVLMLDGATHISVDEVSFPRAGKHVAKLTVTTADGSTKEISINITGEGLKAENTDSTKKLVARAFNPNKPADPTADADLSFDVAHKNSKDHQGDALDKDNIDFGDVDYAMRTGGKDTKHWKSKLEDLDISVDDDSADDLVTSLVTGIKDKLASVDDDNTSALKDLKIGEYLKLIQKMGNNEKSKEDDLLGRVMSSLLSDDDVAKKLAKSLDSSTSSATSISAADALKAAINYDTAYSDSIDDEISEYQTFAKASPQSDSVKKSIKDYMQSDEYAKLISGLEGASDGNNNIDEEDDGWGDSGGDDDDDENSSKVDLSTALSNANKLATQFAKSSGRDKLVGKLTGDNKKEFKKIAELDPESYTDGDSVLSMMKTIIKDNEDTTVIGTTKDDSSTLSDFEAKIGSWTDGTAKEKDKKALAQKIANYFASNPDTFMPRLKDGYTDQRENTINRTNLYNMVEKLGLIDEVTSALAKKGDKYAQAFAATPQAAAAFAALGSQPSSNTPPMPPMNNYDPMMQENYWRMMQDMMFSMMGGNMYGGMPNLGLPQIGAAAPFGAYAGGYGYGMQPMMGQPMMAQPMMGQPMMAQPMMGQPMMAQPMMGQPMMVQPMMAQPIMAPAGGQYGIPMGNMAVGYSQPVMAGGYAGVMPAAPIAAMPVMGGAAPVNITINTGPIIIQTGNGNSANNAGAGSSPRDPFGLGIM